MALNCSSKAPLFDPRSRRGDENQVLSFGQCGIDRAENQIHGLKCQGRPEGRPDVVLGTLFAVTGYLLSQVDQVSLAGRRYRDFRPSTDQSPHRHASTNLKENSIITFRSSNTSEYQVTVEESETPSGVPHSDEFTDPGAESPKGQRLCAQDNQPALGPRKGTRCLQYGVPALILTSRR